MELFLAFLKKEHSEETLSFWLAVDNLKKIFARKINSVIALTILIFLLQNRKKKKKLKNQFSRSPLMKFYTTSYPMIRIKRLIYLMKPKRNFLMMQRREFLLLESFDSAQKHIFHLMEHDSFRRFIKTEAYKNYAAKLSNSSKSIPTPSVCQCRTP